ncbi:MAG TPA: hypothetical protein VKS81_07895 [Bacteroidota bacterium]|nr:hypothetical protein [Bacteroidota bacterium]
MGIVQEIIEELTDGSSNLNGALLKTKVLAYKISNKSILDWVDAEIGGYDDVDSIPDYRVTIGTIIGNLSNGFQRVSNYPIPILGLDSEMHSLLTRPKLGQSVSSLEHFVRDSSSSQLISWIPPEGYGLLSKGLANGFVVEYAAVEIYKDRVVQVLNSIRSKLLDFMLQIEKEYHDKDISRAMSDKIETIFTTTVIGNNNVIAAGDGNVQLVTINNSKGDFKELSKLLKAHEVESVDIKDLETIIDNDAPDPKNRMFGPKVKQWMKKMIGKAIDGSWKVGIEVAAKILGEAISRYYGFK